MISHLPPASLGPDPAELAAVLRELDEVLEDLAAASCDCGHTDHLLDLVRNTDTGEVSALRLGVCVADACTCRGGRA